MHTSLQEKMELEKNNRLGSSMCGILLYSWIEYQPTFATDMQANPVLGGISRVLTFRSYEISDGDKTISTEIPQVDGAEEGYSKMSMNKFRRS